MTFQTLHACNDLPYTHNRFFWNTFERDWNRSEKYLGGVLFYSNHVQLGGKMRYDNDWYTWMPASLYYLYTPFEWFGWEEKVNFSSWKAHYWVYDVPN